MFISEQYSWLANVSEGFGNAMLEYGIGLYLTVGHLEVNACRDVDLTLIGL